MTTRFPRTSSTLTAVALITLGCALAGCGRKAGLDLPPSASSYNQAPGDAVDPNATSAATAQGNLFDTTTNTEKAPVAPRGPKKRIILDPILD